MSELNANYFDFDQMKERLGADPFAEAVNKYKTDDRFYTLTKDDNGNGSALIIFLPDSECRLFQKVYKINSTFIVNGKKRFVSEFSPSTIGLPDPFQEEWQKYWNAGDKENAQKFGRTIRYVTNIKVINDPAKPENNGKVFLYEVGSKMFDKIRQALEPSEQDLALGTERLEVYNPLKGVFLKLTSSKGANGFINYDSSTFISKPQAAVYKSAEEAVKEIKEKTYKLSDFTKPENFKSYDELKKQLEWVTFKTQDQTVKVSEPEAKEPEIRDAQFESVANTQSVQNTQNAPVPEPRVEEPKQAESVDDLLKGLL